MRPVRLSAKFLVLILGIIIVFFSILSGIVIDREAELLRRKAEEKEHLLAQTIVADLRDNMLAGRPRSTLGLMEVLRGSYGLVRLEVLRKDGLPAFGGQGPRRVIPQLAEAIRTGRELDFEEQGVVPLHTNLFPLHNERECRRCHANAGNILGVILISHTLEDTLAEVESSKRQLALLFAVLLLVVGALLYLTVRRLVLVPLDALHRGAEIIGGGNLSHRIVNASRDEFGDLSRTMNTMAEKLQETYGGLEQMVKVRTTELNDSVRLMQGILSSMSSGVALLSREGVVRLINRPGAWILGQGHVDLTGKRLADIVPETAAFLTARVGAYEEITVQTPDDIATPVGFTCSFYGGWERDEDRIVVFQDLTELKALQAELMNEERFASMGRVVAGVAHEIRNPLFGISAIGQIFERDLKDPAHQELVRALLAETRRLNQLVEELLIYGRPMKLKRENADLRLLWEEVLDLHHDELKRREIRVTGDYAVRHPVAYFDPHQMRQVFLNILRNAIEAMPKGGAISIRMMLADNYLLFRVADGGTGIPKESLEHIFDLFYTTKPKGTGLGLAICRKIMRDHGGDIAIDSVEGQGTIVTITLPYRGKADGEAVPAV